MKLIITGNDKKRFTCLHLECDTVWDSDEWEEHRGELFDSCPKCRVTASI